MSAECPSCLPLDCSGLPDDALYSLESETFPFVLVCPRGFDCSHNADIHLVCCGQELAVTFPPAATQDQRRDITASLVAECSRRQQFCGEFNPPSGDPTAPPPPTRTLYFNEPAYCDVKCPDGNVFRYRVMAGVFIMPTQEQANYVAAQYACRLAKDHQICLSDLLTDLVCAGVSYSQSIKATGKYLAVYPDADWWEISEGTLPPGLTFHGGFLTPHQVLIDGTPTTAGVYTFTVRVTEQTFGSAFGDYTEKEYTITVAAISPSSLADGTIGTTYSQQFTVDPDHDVETEVWSLSSGTLPAGLEFSEDGLLSGTPTGLGASYNLTFQVKFEDTASGKTVTCSKALTLTVNGSFPDPFAYYNLDAWDGVKVVDIFGGKNLTSNINGSPTVVAGIISNAYRMSFFRVDRTDSDFDFGGLDFTIRFWLKRPIAGTGQIMDIAALAPNGVWLASLVSSGGQKVRFTVFKDDNVINGAVTSDAITLGDWNHVVFWHQTGVEVGIVINNGIPQVTPYLDGMDPSAHQFRLLSFNSTGVNAPVIDEISIWKGQVLTADQIATDYNGGVGRTWPW